MRFGILLFILFVVALSFYLKIQKKIIKQEKTFSSMMLYPLCDHMCDPWICFFFVLSKVMGRQNLHDILSEHSLGQILTRTQGLIFKLRVVLRLKLAAFCQIGCNVEFGR